MTLTRILMVSLVPTIGGGMLAAEPYPEECRFWSCGAVPTATGSPPTGDNLPDAFRIGTREMPVTTQTIVAGSRDGQVHACIGYDAFGDPHLMCLLVP